MSDFCFVQVMDSDTRDALQNMLLGNTCRIKLVIDDPWGPAFPGRSAIAEAIKASSSIHSVACPPCWYPYISRDTHHFLVSNGCRNNASELVQTTDIDTVSFTTNQLTFVEGLLDAERQGSQVRKVTVEYPFPLPPEDVRAKQGKAMVSKLSGSTLVTQLQVPSDRLLPADDVMMAWLRDGPIRRLVVEFSRRPDFIPKANQVLQEKGMRPLVEAAANIFVSELLKIDALPDFEAHIVDTCLPTATATALVLLNRKTASKADSRLYEKWGLKRQSGSGTPQITNPPHDEQSKEGPPASVVAAFV
jgi:hypothetical protein